MRKLRKTAPHRDHFVVLTALILTATQLVGTSRGQADEADVLSRPLFLQVNTGSHTAPVRALAFTSNSGSSNSGSLCTGGMDKVVHVWKLAERRPSASQDALPAQLRETSSRERTIRWEVEHGLRGSIHALACSSKSGLLAIGGYGYRGSLGEIVWVDPADGSFKHSEFTGHRQSIAALGYSPDGEWLVSADVSGRVLIRREGDAPIQVYAADNQSTGLRPVTFLGNGSLVLPGFEETSGRTPTWRLQLHDVAMVSRVEEAADRPAREPSRVLGQPHYGAVTALAGSSDGRYLASADLARRLYLWDLEADDAPQLLSDNRMILALCFSQDGRTLLAGSGIDPQTQQAELQVWDVPTTALRRARRVTTPVLACAVSPDGKRLAYVAGRGTDAIVEDLDSAEQTSLIRGGSQVARIALADQPSGYQVVFEKNEGASVQEEQKPRVFDPATLSMNVDSSGEAPLPPDAFRGDWQAAVDLPRNRLQLSRQGLLRGYLQIDRALQGGVQCHCWIADQQGEPIAVAVGTDVHNGVYVYDLASRSLLRFFRGHHARVTSLGVTKDQRYLVSGSADGTIRYWSLAKFRDENLLLRRWGADFAVDDGALVAVTVDDSGPLYQKGLREGDVVSEIAWRDPQQQDHAEQDPQTMRRRLEGLPWFTQVGFKTMRDERPRELFQQVAGWHHLLAVFVTEHDWIAWTPAGYYACSAGGERLIGWQVNNQLGERPSFFPAVQFYKSLHRPDVVRQLLEEGSLNKAIARVGGEQTQVVEVLPPRVNILSPRAANMTVNDPQLQITAEAEAVGGHPVTRMHLLVNGSPSIEHAKGIVRERSSIRESWTISLPPGRHRVAVMAESTVSQGISEEIQVEFQAKEAKQSLYLLAVGVSEYPGSLALNYSDADAENVTAVINERSPPLFDVVEAKVIKNREATRSNIEAGLRWLSEKMSLGDLGIVFFSGHGLRQQETFFLLPADVDVEDIGASCISDVRIKEFCKAIGGRGNLLVMIDACHSGAVQLNQLALELARPDYGVIVMASSTGDQKSIESSDWGAGAFTKALTEGLLGEADRFGDDKTVRYDELGAYISYRVMELTQFKQMPLMATPGIPPFPLTRVP